MSSKSSYCLGTLSWPAIAALTLGLLLQACGGGSEDSNTQPLQAPAIGAVADHHQPGPGDSPQHPQVIEALLRREPPHVADEHFTVRSQLASQHAGAPPWMEEFRIDAPGPQRDARDALLQELPDCRP